MSASSPARQHALDTIAKFWAIDSPPKCAKRGTVLVDLMHSSVEYLCRGLVIARMIKAMTGYKVVGLIGEPGVVKSSAILDRAMNLSLATAFEVEEVIEVPDQFEVQGNDQTLLEALSISKRGPIGQHLTDSDLFALVALKSGTTDFPIGQGIHETILRAELIPRPCYGPILARWCEHVFGFTTWASDLLERFSKPPVFVTGHIDYLPWGHLARHCVNKGGRTVWFRCDNRIPVNFLDTVSSDETLNATLRRAESEWFSGCVKRLEQSPALHAACDQHVSRIDLAVKSGFGRNWRWDRSEPLPILPEFVRKQRTYILFTHTFTDQPAADLSLFPDHLAWLTATLEWASKHKVINLLVKVHPWDKSYDKTGRIEQLEETYSRFDNIRFSRAALPIASILEVCEAGISVRGTPGIEMTAAGLPMILAGQSVYSGCDFCILAPSIEAYFELLSSGVPEAFDIQSASQRARLYAGLDRFIAAPASPLCPTCLARQGDDDWWRCLEQGFAGAELLTDPLFLALRHAWSTRNGKVLSLTMWDGMNSLLQR